MIFKNISLVLVTVFLLLTNQSAKASPANGELIVGVSQEFETLNPITTTTLAGAILTQMAVRSLVIINEDWQRQCEVCIDMPSLENGGAKIVEEGGKKKMLVTWQIKPNAKWGDGVDITADDMKFSWEVGRSPNVLVGEKDIYNKIEEIRLDPSDKKKFTVVLAEPAYDYAIMMEKFYIVSKHLEQSVWEKSKNEPEGYAKQSLYNTDPTNPGLYFGPFRPSELKLGSHVIFVPNPLFYGKKPALKKVIFKLIPDTSTMEANLLSGSVDMISELGLTLDQAIAMEKRFAADPALNAKYKVLYKAGVINEHIDLNIRDGHLLSDVRVRKALMYSLDRDKMVNALFDGKQPKALHVIHPLDPYYTEDVTLYPYDLAKASALLDEAGWKMSGDGYRYKDGKKLSLVLMSTAGNKTRELVEVYMQNEWKKAGIEITMKNEPGRVFFGETVNKALFQDMAMYAHSFRTDMPPMTLFHSTNIPTPANAYSGNNKGGWVNKIVDEALEKTYTSFDLEERKKQMAIVLKAYTDEVPSIPLYWRDDEMVMPRNLTGVAPTGLEYASTSFAENWAWQQ